MLRRRPHPLAWPRQWAAVRHSVRFGQYLVVFRIAWYLYSNADFAVVGRVLGKIVLGAYSLLGAALSAVWLVEGPVRSEPQDEADALRHPIRDRRIWRLSSGSSALIFTQVAVTGFVVLFLESRRDFSAMWRTASTISFRPL